MMARTAGGRLAAAAARSGAAKTITKTRIRPKAVGRL
jgi:hypothetical protein